MGQSPDRPQQVPVFTTQAHFLAYLSASILRNLLSGLSFPDLAQRPLDEKAVSKDNCWEQSAALFNVIAVYGSDASWGYEEDDKENLIKKYG